MSNKSTNNKYENGLFIFRRDFRLIDNIGLHNLNRICKNIYPIFIFTPEQVSKENKFKSDNAVQFMIESLNDLDSSISKMCGKLQCYYGDNNKVLSDLIKSLHIDVVGFNVDCSPYSIKRDISIIEMCQKMNIYVEHHNDYYLQPLGTVLNGSGETYQKFTPFYNACLKKKVDAPMAASKIHFAKDDTASAFSLNDAMKRFVPNENPNKLVNGGRANALKQLKQAAINIKKYEETRDELYKPTSHLSAYIKFGCVSVREVYKVFHANKGFIRQLYWRDFYANILYAFPHVLSGYSLKPKYDNIKWNHNSAWFKKWCDGETGFPVVDAGMRQMNATGYMENRARLIVMSFLIKTLLIDWRHGEKYFATKLTDYDPASNNGNIQWVSGSGADSQQYMRIFSPFRQQEQHDAGCEYIKKWVPELASLEPSIIHNWDTEYANHKDIAYPKPMCDFSEQRIKALEMYHRGLAP
jgi:deoxyribodipyrimidine photo-lyase